MLTDLNQYPVIVDLPVQWGEMDSFQHVNNAIYFKYFEHSRIAYLTKIHYSETLAETDIGIIVASIQAKFILPLTYPDTIKIGCKISSMTQDRFVMDYAILSTSTNKIVATGSSIIVAYDYKNKCKTNIPDSYKNSIKNIENCHGQISRCT